MSYTVDQVIKIAKAEVGYLEKASNSMLDSKTANAGNKNYTKYARDLAKAGYYQASKQGYAWCDLWFDWVHYMAAGKNAKLAQEVTCQTGPYGAGCAYSMRYYQQAGRFYTSPKVGDQIFFKNKSGEVCHTGLVYAVDKSYVYTIEGNTSTASGVVANGGGVCKKKYKLNYKLIAGYGRPNYDKSEVTSKPVVNSASKNAKVLEFQRAAVADKFSMEIDGIWGPECVKIAKQAIVKYRLFYKYKNLTKIVQNAVGVKADGLCGPSTSAAIKKYQVANGLIADGQVGLNTWKKILGVN